mgnify:CR=1 FL=1
MGEMGLQPAEFYDLTWAEYQRAALGYRVRLDRAWDMTRNQIAAIYQSASGKRVRPNEIYRCIFDRKAEPAVVTPEEWKTIKKAFKL